MKIAVLIPAHNAEKTITEVISKVKVSGFAAVVVDDGSKDKTSDYAKAAGAIVLKHEKNLGKGAALRTGFRYAQDNGFDAAITIDADGQHDPALLNNFVDKAVSEKSVFIVGNRMDSTAGMPLVRVLTNRFMSLLLSKKMGQYVPDSQCGYRFIMTHLLAKMQLKTSRYEIESEMLIQAARLGAHIDSVPIPSIYDGHKSRINPFVDTLRFIRLMMTL